MVRQTPSSPPWSRGSGGDTQLNPKNEKKISNKAFHPVYPRLDSARQQKEESTELDEARLAVARTELEAANTEVHSAQKELKMLGPRLSFSPKLPTRCCQSGQLGKKAGERAACVKRE